tara:strand:- start:10582 stop:11991 length:1410 start_codon:yes stop_codon:yes gene_type:complete
VLPTFKQLAFPSEIPLDIKNTLQSVNKIDANPLNLFRVHWYNMWKKSTQASIPEYIELPSELTGVNARIVMILGNRFPMIDAHKVLAAYACLVPRIVSGRFDPTQQRAVWPSTGNYARGGIAISRLLRCRGVAVLPENMSQERFDWLERWVGEPEDIIRTPGSESNVKEIYDACQILAKDKRNIIVNQFSEFANHIIHYYASGIALEDIFLKLSQRESKLRLAAFVAASGSSGTLGAGDWLKERYESLIVAVEALECPTMLYNGYGEHNIQGIGDKHIPLIHNVMNTDLVAAISDRATDSLNLVFNSRVGKDYLRDELGLDIEFVDQLRHFGLSSIANMLASVKAAKVLDLGPEDIIMSVATDGSELYKSEKEQFRFSAYPDGFTKKDVEKIIEERLINASPNHVEKLDNIGRNRIFNLGYFTWVEQQGVNLEDFEVRRTKQFWESMHDIIPIWDQCIREFNFEVGISD